MIMEWIVIVTVFAGPTSPDYITIKRFDTKETCISYTKVAANCLMVPKELK